jgi:hypothetical protein
MLINQNQNITKKIQEQLGLSELTGYPRKVAESIVPVLISNEDEYSYIARSHTDTSPGTDAIYTTPTGYDFYLTGAWITARTTGADEYIDISITGVLGGETQIILKSDVASSNIANTFTSGSNSLNLAYPLKLDEGSVINMVSADNNTTWSGSAGIIGYLKKKL